jgi:hypothetical protein
MSLKKEYQGIIKRVNHLRSIEDSGDLNKKIKRVAVILTGSRSGSSLMKTVVSRSNDVAYLSGEEEPFYILSGNGFPWSSDSDGFNTIKNKQHLLDNIFDDLGINDKVFNYRKTLNDWRNRILLQFPDVDETLINFQLPKYVYNYYSQESDYTEASQKLAFTLFKEKSGLYDMCEGSYDFMSQQYKIEEPPFVNPPQRRSFTKEDIEDKVLVFKTPQDCYRIGIFEQLFPNADIKYIHLTRGFAQTLNGLMDGWLSDTGFFAHDMSIIKEKLNIEGYTDVKSYGDRWWKFDLPPNWKDYKDAPLHEVCLNQWYSAHTHILNSGKQCLHVKFEDFLTNPSETANRITEYLGINPINVDNIPVVMATHKPEQHRWLKRSALIHELSERSHVKELMSQLNYKMEPELWV